MSERKPLALVIDFGTQSIRVGAVDLEGNIVALIKRPYAPVYVSAAPGLAEQDANFYWGRFIECAKEFSKNHSNLYKDVIGMSLTSFRDTAVLLDKDLKPIRPCIHWLDQRLAEAARETMPIWKRALFKLVGMENTLIFNRRKTVALWYQQNEPLNWAKTYRYVNISTYIHYKLTGNLTDSPSGFTGHYPINYRTGEWYKNYSALKNIFDIPRTLMPDLAKPGTKIGCTTREVFELTGIPEGIPFFVGGADKSCECLGLGSVEPHVGSISYGTACSINVVNTKYHEPEPFLPAYPSVLEGFYNMEVQIYRGYWMLSWFIQEFAQEESSIAAIQHLVVEEVLNRKLEQIPPGCNGLVLQPFWGAGLRRPLARGSIIGFNDGHTKMHLYRAILEGIAFALRDGLEGMEKSQHKKVSELRISGGGSQSDVICQITADIFGRPVSRVQTFETSTLGVAISTFIAAGYFKGPTEAIEAMSKKSITFTPNPEAREKYEYLYRKVYKKMYAKLKPMFTDIKDY